MKKEIKNKKAFTLIELLVVILIIGILAAIALPQYQVAVEKSRFTQSIVIARAIRDAQDLYYLNNNTYSDDFAELDLSFSPTASGTSFSLSDKIGILITPTYVYVIKQEGTIGLVVPYTGQQYTATDQWVCQAETDNQIANQVCKNLGGVFIDKVTSGCYIKGGNCSRYGLSL